MKTFAVGDRVVLMCRGRLAGKHGEIRKIIPDTHMNTEFDVHLVYVDKSDRVYPAHSSEIADEEW